MTRAVYYTAATLDGFLATDQHSLDWLMRQDFDDAGPYSHAEFVERVGALVMGSATYEWLLEHEEEWPYEVPAWVLTTRTLPRRGDGVRFASGDVGELWSEIEASASGLDVWIVGGGDVAGQVADSGHLDAMIVSLAPVTLGAGRPLLPRSVDLRLVGTARNRDFVCAEYEVLSSAR